MTPNGPPLNGAVPSGCEDSLNTAPERNVAANGTASAAVAG